VVRAQLLERERLARATAERMGQRTMRLQTVTAALATASTIQEVCEAVVTEGVTALGASTGGLWLANEERTELELVTSQGYTATAQRLTRISMERPGPLPVVDVFRRGEPVWLTGRQEFERDYQQIAAVVVRPEIAIACLPLTAQGQCLGGLAFTFDERRDFAREERDFLLVLAGHCAQALERARLFDLESQARKRAEDAQARSAFLLEASTLLSSSLSFQENLAGLTRLAVPRLADWFAIELRLDPTKPSEQLVLAHADATKVELVKDLRRRYPPDPSRGVRHVMETGKSELYEDVTEEIVAPGARDADHLRLFKELGLRSGMIVPMVARGKTWGAITFVSAESGRRYRREDLEMAELLGRRAAIAIDNALLYEEAQAATRAREEILAVVSHDLRNPVAGILMGASNILRLELTDRAASRVRKNAEVVQRSAEHMARLIDDLGDFSSLQGGRLTIERCPCDAGEIVEAAVEVFAALAQDRELRLETDVGAGLPLVSCDRDRIIQALGNLVSNALKVTAAGGSVRVGARHGAAEVVWFVEDTGPGIPAEDVPRVFERHWRAASAGYKGHGLGLTIAKGLIEAHGGRIDLRSEVGRGTRFEFAIPVSLGET
jgi:signal transduction histidine kinase